MFSFPFRHPNNDSRPCPFSVFSLVMYYAPALHHVRDFRCSVALVAWLERFSFKVVFLLACSGRSFPVMQDTLTMLRRSRLHCTTKTKAQVSSNGGSNRAIGGMLDIGGE